MLFRSSTPLSRPSGISRTFRHFVTLALAAASLLISPAAEPSAHPVDLTRLPAPAAGTVDFTRDIQPILSTHCLKCHGAEKQKGGLRLDVRSAALRGGDSGPVLVQDKSAESRLIQLVAGLDVEKVMPPKGERLTSQQVGVLRAWIDQGLK